MKIQIEIYDDNDNLLGRREALSWETAQEALGKLENAIEAEAEAQIEQEQLEENDD